MKAKPKTATPEAARGEVLIALLKDKSDFAILQEQGWYRIPVASAPKRWPPKWLAFYQPKAFKENAFRVHHYGEVTDIQVVPRNELFPNEFESARSSRQYYKVTLKSLKRLTSQSSAGGHGVWCSSPPPGINSAAPSRSMTCLTIAPLKMLSGSSSNAY